MTDKAKTGPLFRKLNELAPYPPGKGATAAGVSRWLAAQGLLSCARSESGNDKFPPTPDDAHLVGAQFAAAFFLQGVAQLSQEAADFIAQTAVTAWLGGDFGTVLWNLLGDEAEAITAVAKELAAAMAPPPAAVTGDQLRADLAAVMPFASFTGAPLAAVQRLLGEARREDVTHA
jgi:hypothetical protein